MKRKEKVEKSLDSIKKEEINKYIRKFRTVKFVEGSKITALFLTPFVAGAMIGSYLTLSGLDLKYDYNYYNVYYVDDNGEKKFYKTCKQELLDTYENRDCYQIEYSHTEKPSKGIVIGSVYCGAVGATILGLGTRMVFPSTNAEDNYKYAKQKIKYLKNKYK